MSLRQARRLRGRQTWAEAQFWRMVRGRSFDGLKFRRQVPIGRFIVDFVCLERRLVVEFDGGIHDAPFRNPERDARRDAWLASEGYRVLRFRNAEFETDANRVLNGIRAALDLPSPLGGEGGRGAVG